MDTKKTPKKTMEVLDRTFYHDDGLQVKANELKRKMTLDFNSTPKTKQQKMQNLLASPDLSMLKLASPELEKMIINANGMVTTTPTPTQFIFPKFVTEEQENYAKGFVEALAELHNVRPVKPETLEISRPDSADSESSNSNVSYTYAPLELTTTTSLPGGLVSSVPNNIVKLTNTKTLIPSHTLTTAQLENVGFTTVKEEPQTVPQSLQSPPLSPINMANQEVIKLERKRARNRIAARKCRTRKLERIARLEERVDDLKNQNNDLATTANSLRDQVCKLKQQIIEHVNSGCQIMMSNNLTAFR